MATKGPKQESLSRYFKDLDECEGSSDESDDDINKGDTILSSQDKNSSSNSGDKSDKSNTCSQSVSSDKTTDSKKSKTLNTAQISSDTIRDEGTPNIRKSQLPSALECLSTKNTPSFLKVSEKKEVNWDEYPKKFESEADTSYKSNAVPPPSSYEPMTDPGIKVVDSEGRKRKTIADDLEDQMTSSRAYKVHKEDDEEDCS